MARPVRVEGRVVEQHFELRVWPSSLLPPGSPQPYNGANIAASRAPNSCSGRRAGRASAPCAGARGGGPGARTSRNRRAGADGRGRGPAVASELFAVLIEMALRERE